MYTLILKNIEYVKKKLRNITNSHTIVCHLQKKKNEKGATRGAQVVRR